MLTLKNIFVDKLDDDYLLPPTKYIILIGDNITSEYMAIGYHYETIDVRYRNSMPLIFDKGDDAIAYAFNLIDIAKYYANRIENSVNRKKAVEDAQNELEKITSTNKSIIIPLIYDLLYHDGKTENAIGLYDYKCNIVNLDYMEAIRNMHERKMNKKEKEEKA